MNERKNKKIIGEKVIKKPWGYVKSKQNETHTHVILTDSEFSKMEWEISNLNTNINKLKEDFKTEVAKYEKSADDSIIEIRNKTNERIADVVKEMTEHKKRADIFENLNKKLINDAIERSNMKRGLTPRRKHVGYIFLSVEEYIFNCECLASGKSNKTKVLKLPCFRVRLQSPYDVTIFAFEAVKALIYDDIMGKICELMGIDMDYEGSFIKFSEDEIRKIWAEDENFLFKITHKAVFQNKNFWEVEFFTRDMPVISPDITEKTEIKYQKNTANK